MIFTRKEFVKALSEGVHVKGIKTKDDAIMFCDGLIGFINKAENNYWACHNDDPGVMTIDYGNESVLIVTASTDVVRMLYPDPSELPNKKAVSNAAYGVMLYCGLVNGTIEQHVSNSNDDTNKADTNKVEGRKKPIIVLNTKYDSSTNII